MGADYIEQDLQLTKDGVLVALHDPTLDRTARPGRVRGDCTGLVIEKTLAQIKTCDVGSWFNEAYPAVRAARVRRARIPTLEEVFQRYGTSVNYYIETKNPEDAPGMEEKLLALLDEYSLRAGRREVAGPDPVLQRREPAEDPRARPVATADPALLRRRRRARRSGEARRDREPTRSASARRRSVDAALVDAAHARCLDVHPYTVNDPAEMENLIALGVDGMFTNFPDRLDAVLGKEARAENPAPSSPPMRPGPAGEAEPG